MTCITAGSGKRKLRSCPMHTEEEISAAIAHLNKANPDLSSSVHIMFGVKEQWRAVCSDPKPYWASAFLPYGQLRLGPANPDPYERRLHADGETQIEAILALCRKLAVLIINPSARDFAPRRRAYRMTQAQ